jgi:hypothetical protein
MFDLSGTAVRDGSGVRDRLVDPAVDVERIPGEVGGRPRHPQRDRSVRFQRGGVPVSLRRLFRGRCNASVTRKRYCPDRPERRGEWSDS